jgi:hypothetical protein
VDGVLNERPLSELPLNEREELPPKDRTVCSLPPLKERAESLLIDGRLYDREDPLSPRLKDRDESPPLKLRMEDPPPSNDDEDRPDEKLRLDDPPPPPPPPLQLRWLLPPPLNERLPPLNEEEWFPPPPPPPPPLHERPL